MAIKSITLNSDDGIRVGGVTSHADPTAPAAADGATVVGRLYDRKKLQPVTADVAAGVALVPVKSAEPFEDADPVELRLDDATFHTTTIASRDLDANTITLNAAIPGGRTVKARTIVKRKLGGDIAMSLYGGTPAPNDDTWGYIGTVADTHEGVHLDDKIRAEVDIDDGAGRRRIVVMEARVVEG